MSYNRTNWHDGDVITQKKLNNIEQGIYDLDNKTLSLSSETNIGCVLRPTIDISNPWILFGDGAHESKGVNSIIYNSDGTLTLNFDKTYDKIRSFNAYGDEMMKIYGLDVGASTGLNSAKLFLISNLNVGLAIRFSVSDNSVNVDNGSGFVESATWVSGVGCVVKFKNVPKQTPNAVQATLTNALHLDATVSITGNREITIKFYKKDGTLIENITGNWSCMVNADFRGLVNFNCISKYDSSILSSMAIMYSANMKEKAHQTANTFDLKTSNVKIEDEDNNFISENVEGALE